MLGVEIDELLIAQRYYNPRCRARRLFYGLSRVRQGSRYEEYAWRHNRISISTKIAVSMACPGGEINHGADHGTKLVTLLNLSQRQDSARLMVRMPFKGEPAGMGKYRCTVSLYRSR